MPCKCTVNSFPFGNDSDPLLVWRLELEFNCLLETAIMIVLRQMSDDNPFVIPEMEPTLRKQIQECNWQVVNVTTPANYFHLLRRQVSLSYCAFCFSDSSVWFAVCSHVIFLILLPTVGVGL